MSPNVRMEKCLIPKYDLMKPDVSQAKSEQTHCIVPALSAIGVYYTPTQSPLKAFRLIRSLWLVWRRRSAAVLGRPAQCVARSQQAFTLPQTVA
jgi:hypothetical protein